MDEKLKTTINKIVQLSKQNPEFDTELRKAIDILPSGNLSCINNERLSQIYEYCIEKIVRKQAADFYYAFPINEISIQLQYDS